MEFRNKRVVVVGLGKSGVSACRWLAGQGARVTVSEIRGEGALDTGMLEDLRRRGVLTETGGHREDTFLEADLIVLSPGVPLDLPPLVKAGEKGIPVLGEMELAGRQIDIPVVAITGTNGKSTATALLGCMLETAGKRVFVGGNIGTPFMDYLAGRRAAEVAVVEVSSFQLDTIDRFHPRVSMILNISPDHLDRYSDYEAYMKSKLKIFKNQKSGDVVILNDDDPKLSRVAPDGKATCLRYGTERREGRQAYLEGGKVKAHLLGGEHLEWDTEDFRLPGEHNLHNLMGCTLAALSLEIDPKDIQEAINRFKGLPHRMEFVGNAGGIHFYDDSKATNVDAAARAVEGFDRPVLLIAGGRDKGADYAPLVEVSKGKVKVALLLGEARSLLKAAFADAVPTLFVQDMADAVEEAYSRAEPGDVVLLAPACSSFDMFEDYTQRGRVFQDEVRKRMYGRR